MCPGAGNVLSTVVCEVVKWVDTGSALAGPAAEQGIQAVGGSVLEGAAKSAGQSAGQLITTSLGWWTVTGSVDFGSPALKIAQSYTVPLMVIMLTMGVVIAAAKTALMRKGEPLVNLTTNLITFIVVSVAGMTLLAALQAGGDAYSAWILKDAGAQLGDRFALAAASPYAATFGVIMVSMFAILIAIVQFILMLFRSAALVVLAGMLPLAGAASVLQGNTDSAKRVVTWSIAIVLYKPIGATIYAQGFLTVGKGADLLTMLQGVVILIMAVIALPLLIRLFSWASTSISSGGGGMAAAAGLAGLAMARRGKGGTSGGEDSGDDSTGGTDPTTTGPAPDGGLATQHSQEMETETGTGGGDTPANSSPGPGPGADPGSGSGGEPGEGAESSLPSPVPDPTASGDDGDAAATAATAATAGASGGATAAGGDTPASTSAGGPAATVAGEAHDAAEGATASATDPGPLGPDEPS